MQPIRPFFRTIFFNNTPHVCRQRIIIPTTSVLAAIFVLNHITVCIAFLLLIENILQ